MIEPSPPTLRAVITQQGTRTLPRSILIALCLLIIVPGFVLRTEPWKPEAMSFATALDLLEGHWLEANLAHGLSALSKLAFEQLLGPYLALRLPYILLLGACFALVWYASYTLAREDDAQPAVLPFGGQPHPVQFARAVADGSLLGLMACIGLVDRGHQGTPELAQMTAVAGLCFALAKARGELAWSALRAAAAVAASLVLLGLVGAPRLAMGCALIVLTLAHAHRLHPYISRATMLCLLPLAALAWHWRASLVGIQHLELNTTLGFARLLIWFWWPLWLVILVSLWGRQGAAARLVQLKSWRISMPLALIALFTLVAWLTGLDDQLLLVGLPLLAVLAALCLPYLRRTALALIDWFALFVFSGLALLSWAVWSSIQLGWPARLGESVRKRYAGVDSIWNFDIDMFGLALFATLAWATLLAWRTARVEHPLWKGMVISAGGVALTWTLVHTINLPLLNYARSYGSIARSLDASVPRAECATPRDLLPLPQALLRVISSTPFKPAGCNYILLQHSNAKPLSLTAGEALIWTGRRPSERDEAELFSLVRKNPP